MKITIVTLGCKVNQAESAALEAKAAQLGHTLSDEGDAYIVNTCAVTAEAARKSRQAIRKLLASGKPVYVTGCYPRIDEAEIAELGVQKLEDSELSPLLAALSESAGGKPSKRSRALLKIQDGCDNYCSYCIIPYARGRSRSIPVEAALAEVRRFASEGVRETIITGIEIAGYGRDIPGSPDLAELVTLIAAEVPQMRLQLGSLEPRTVTREFCETLRGSVVPKFHLSLQSGSDSVLKRMNRRYDSARFAESIALLREFFPGCFISADIIVGFPGETDAEFGESLEFARLCAFDHLHVFPYSPRPGTKAADMDAQIEKSVKKGRCELMRSVCQ